MAKPFADPAQRKSTIVQVRVTSAQLLELRRLAAASGMTVSALMRRRALTTIPASDRKLASGE